MGKYLDILKRAGLYDINDRNDQSPSVDACDISDISDKRPSGGCISQGGHNFSDTFGRLNRFCRIFSALEARCPDFVPVDRWQSAVEDGRRFLARWGDQAEALGWTSRDLFGLHRSPPDPHPSYSRLSRYDETGLVWLLQGREVVALTEATAAIQSPTGAVTVYRRFNKPALGPLGDSLDDLR
jgi:hypothetical protein